jgi:dihydrofolate reductase
VSAGEPAGRPGVTRGRNPIEIVVVVAVADNDVIGQGGGLPWRLKTDLRHFRALTLGKPVIMGRKTCLAIGRPLPGRTSIVVSRDPAFTAPGVVVAGDLGHAIAAARGDALRRGANAVMIIGGADIYAQTLPLADRMVVTRVHMRPDGDVRFGPIDPRLWRERERSEHAAGPEDEAAFTLLVYERARPHLEDG